MSKGPPMPVQDVGRKDWTHESIRLLGGSDPVSDIIQRGQALTLRAIEGGWQGPPYDPFALADFLRIPVIPSTDVADARTVPSRGGEIRIEYNPMRPRARVRYSVAHEIAHTLFPDCAD